MMIVEKCKNRKAYAVSIFLIFFLAFFAVNTSARDSMYASYADAREACRSYARAHELEQWGRVVGIDWCNTVYSSFISSIGHRYFYKPYCHPDVSGPSHPRCRSPLLLNDENLVNNGGGSNNTCYPVNISTGNKYYSFLEFENQRSAISFQRYYNSVNGGWTHDYGQYLEIMPDEIILYRPEGSVISFSVNELLFSPPSNRKEKLSFFNGTYQLLLPDNTIENYGLSGHLKSIDSPHYGKIFVEYSEQTTSILYQNQQLLIHKNASGDLMKVILPTNKEINYSYSESYPGVNVLSAVDYDGGYILNYFYEDLRFPTYITGIEDENGHRISSVQYDDQGRAISSEAGPLNSGIERTQIKYNEDGTRTLTNALGKQSTYHFTQFNGEYKMTQVEGHPSANCAGANQAYTYDANGFMASKTDWQGNITTYIHNDRGQEISRTEASGTPQARTIITQWHAEFNLPIKITEPKRETIMSYEANGRLLSRQVKGVE